MATEYIQIKVKDRLLIFITHNGMLNAKYLKHYVFDAIGLSYSENGKKDIIKIEGTNIQLIEGVNEYVIIQSEGI